MQKYQSKKDETIIAECISTDERCCTAMLKYLSGDNVGKTFSVSSSTLKRWWKKYTDEEEQTVESGLNIDMEKVNEPYPEPTKQSYIPKPQSVIDYENRGKRFNSDLPDFDSIVDTLGSKAKKVNTNSKYLMFDDKSTLWRKSNFIGVYAAETLWDKLIMKGLTCTENKDKDRPFAFKITTADEYNRVVEVFLNE